VDVSLGNQGKLNREKIETRETNKNKRENTIDTGKEEHDKKAFLRLFPD